MRWFLQNTRKRLTFAARHPAYTLRALVRELTFADERFLARATGATPGAIRAFLNEPFKVPGFAYHLRQCETTLNDLEAISADLYAKKILIQYAVVRAMEPDIVVETGVANGISTAYLLLALEQNKKGTLHSIEVGDASFLPPGRAAGWVVPHWLHARWHLHLSPAETLLPHLLQQLGSIDLFIHDSLHTYEHMWLEFDLAYPHLRLGGLLLADDALWNSAFLDFARRLKTPVATVIRGVGILRA